MQLLLGGSFKEIYLGIIVAIGVWRPF